jgi:hypothetical protein
MSHPVPVSSIEVMPDNKFLPEDDSLEAKIADRLYKTFGVPNVKTIWRNDQTLIVETRPGIKVDPSLRLVFLNLIPSLNLYNHQTDRGRTILFLSLNCC